MDEFDLKKYLAQASHMGHDEFQDVVMNSKSVGAGLAEYITQAHKDGAKILSKYVADDEMLQFQALVSGISTAEMMKLPDEVFDPKDRALLVTILMGNSDLIIQLALSVACTVTGIVCREEWR